MNSPKKILLVQLFSNGDCLYGTAVAKQIKNDYPGCKLTWAIAGFCKDIIAGNPYVDEIAVTDEVAKNDAAALRRYKRKLRAERSAGIWDEIFITTNMDINLALYDGTIRGMILRAYPGEINVPLQPVVVLTQEEKQRVASFAAEHKLHRYKNVILWEYAPQSGQSVLSFEMVMAAAEKITRDSTVCIILSSANKFAGKDHIIDASGLTVRENAALTHYCSLLIGCSSGISWLTTSSAAKFLPMLQLLDPYAYFINATSVDFKRYNIQHNGLIELISFSAEKICDCVTVIINKGFEEAINFNEALPLQFNTTKKVVYNLLVYREFAAIRKHYKIMTEIYGKHPLFLKTFYGAFAMFPFKLITNLLRKALK